MRKKPMSGQLVAGPIGDRAKASDATVPLDAVEVPQPDGQEAVETPAGTPCAGDRTTEPPTEFILVRSGKSPGILSGPVRPPEEKREANDETNT